MKSFERAQWFSMLHGLAVYDSAWWAGSAYVQRKRIKILAYLFSKLEIAAYKKNYALEDQEMEVVGVSRHKREWIETIVRESKNDIPEQWEKFIFLISRPANSEYLTKEKKRQAIADIRKLAFEDLDCKIVVKLHPTERVPKNHDHFFEEIFGEDSYGERWVYSSAHPFVLGKKCLFAIVFHSGVAVDMLALGVPTIERITLIESPSGSESEKRIYETLMAYRGRGLVLPANNYEELKKHAVEILSDKDAVMRRLRPHYEEFFGTGETFISTIVDDIMRAL